MYLLSWALSPCCFRESVHRLTVYTLFEGTLEDVLDLYEEPYDPDRPVVCFDETSKQLTTDKSPGIPAKPGQAQRYDYEYKRNGTRNLFMFCEPLRGWRHLEVTERRTAQDFAHQMKWLVDEAYPEAQVVRLVLDNLNTHKLGSLYETHTPAEARRIAKRLELHHTPKHGSWLNMAEIEFSVFSRQCLNRRIGDEQELKRETAALEDERNRVPATIEWRFSTFDARLKLQHIYPSHSACNGTSPKRHLAWTVRRESPERVATLSGWGLGFIPTPLGRVGAIRSVICATEPLLVSHG